MNAKLLAALALAAALSACVTVGRPFPFDKVSTIRIGGTTQDDVRRTFGRPMRVGLHDGDPSWTYYYVHAFFLNDPTSQDLYIRFSPVDKTVKSIHYNQSAPADDKEPKKGR